MTISKCILLIFLIIGLNGVENLSEDALACVKIIISEYDLQSSEKKSALTKIVCMKIVKDKYWVMLRKIFNESPLVGFFNSYSNIINLFD